jgi:hypothetical protein
MWGILRYAEKIISGLRFVKFVASQNEKPAWSEAASLNAGR